MTAEGSIFVIARLVEPEVCRPGSVGREPGDYSPAPD
jgi:hypothetical protein